MIDLVININRDGLTTSECQDLADVFQSINTDDVISLVECAEHKFQVGQDGIEVVIKRRIG